MPLYTPLIIERGEGGFVNDDDNLKGSDLKEKIV